MIKIKKKGFTLLELLAVIVILAVVILIAITAILPRMENARKNVLLDEAEVYLKAAKEAYVFEGGHPSGSTCMNISDLNENYVKKSSDDYSGAVFIRYINGEVNQSINLTNGRYYVVGSGSLNKENVKDNIPSGFANSCVDFNPAVSEDADTNTLAYKIIMSEGGSTLDENIQTINKRTASVNLSAIESNATNSGLYKAEDDDGGSFYFRGNVSNNWVEFGGFYWRIVRINGDGSIRLLYSGLGSGSHTGDGAVAQISTSDRKTKFSDSIGLPLATSDISGLTNNCLASGTGLESDPYKVTLSST